MLTGERLPASTALRWGLIDEIAPSLESGARGINLWPIIECLA
jgi:enoyl-CoA hydratase/carnithine racemase